MSHHLPIFNKAGMEIGYLRITNDGVAISIWLDKNAVANPGLFVPAVD